MSMYVYKNGCCFSDEPPNENGKSMQLSKFASVLAGDLVRVDAFETFARREESLQEDDGVGGDVNAERIPFVHVDNICGNFHMSMEEVNKKILRLAQHRTREHFYSDNFLFHSIYGRLNFSNCTGTWTFKGVQCLRELADLAWQLGVEPMERRALFAPVFRIRMLSVTLHYHKSIDPNVTTSLFWKVVFARYWCCLSLTPRTDESKNLLFLKLTSWKHAIGCVEADFPDERGEQLVQIVDAARQALGALGESAHPTVSIGVTRNSVIFLRLVFSGAELKAHGNEDLTPFLNLLVRLIEDILRHIGIIPPRSLVNAAWE
jgi:hypothetical protein